MPKAIMPILRSMPVIDKLKLPDRAELLPKIESGELDHIDFKATTFKSGKNKNHYVFQAKDLESFATSFEGQPFLRNHNTSDIDARDGTIIESSLEGHAFKQTVRLTTRRGMTDFVEGKIDRFSIGWFYDDVLCSICNLSWFSYECSHSPGRTYKVGESKTEKTCELVFVNPKGKETSAVNSPAVDGTGIESLQEYKLEVIGESDRRNPNKLLKGVNNMSPKKKVTPEADVQEDDNLQELSENEQAAFSLQGGNEALAEVQEQNKQSKALLIEQCRMLLDTSLAASKLPAASQKALRKPFESKLAKGEYFLATELQEAITEKREELATIQTPANVQGPGRDVSYVGGMFNGKDQFIAAYADLLGAPRPEGLEKLQTRRLRGIQEAYLLGTGDIEFKGGYFEEFALASVDFPGVTADLLNKMLTNAWKDYEEVYGWWQKIVTVEHFTNLNDVKWIKTGTIGSLPTVNERGEYTQLPIGDNKESSAWYKYGGYISITLEDILKDDISALRRLPNEAALGGIRNISEQIAAVFTSNSGAGPTMADTGALFNSTAVTTAGGHANLLTTALGTDYTAWKAIDAAMFKQPLLVKNASGYYGVGKRQAIRPRFCLVPIDLQSQAEALFLPRWEAQAQNVATVSPTWGGRVEPIVVPEWTDATDYAAVADPKFVQGIMLGEIFGVKPQIFRAGSETDPAMFANDESRIKVRQFLNVGVADWRGLHKENVAG